MSGWLWETFRWTDVLDIFILAYILFRALLIMRGTRAIQSLVGLLGLVALFAISKKLQLVSVHWLLEKFSVYVVLAVVILFQQDIRRGLARAGSKLFIQKRPQTTLSTVEELVRASFAMASRRMGALIAIERDARLDDYIDPATAIDAEISQELLLAIFHPTSPLHDGAVALRNGRIAAAQCFLPLTQSKSVSRFFGTRHRAAIGLTDETDALVVIVSEERGTVAIVEGGQILPTPDANALREALQSRLQADTSDAESLGRAGQ